MIFTIAALLLAVIGQKVVQARKQRQLKSLAESFGGEPYHELYFEGGGKRTIRQPNMNFSPEMPGPDWLRKRIGDEYFVEITEVLFDKGSHRILDDAAFKEYCDTIRTNNLPFPQGVVFGDLPVSDSSLAELISFESVTSLHVYDCPNITNDGLRSIARLPKIHYLDLSGTSIDNGGLDQLSGLTELRELSLRRTGVSDAGLIHLNGLHNLEYLSLSGTSVSVAGVKKLEEQLPDCVITY